MNNREANKSLILQLDSNTEALENESKPTN